MGGGFELGSGIELGLEVDIVIKIAENIAISPIQSHIIESLGGRVIFFILRLLRDRGHGSDGDN